jgi:hypothetical protein
MESVDDVVMAGPDAQSEEAKPVKVETESPNKNGSSEGIVIDEQIKTENITSTEHIESSGKINVIVLNTSRK